MINDNAHLAHFTPEPTRALIAALHAPERADYSELAEYTRDEIYEDFFGGGGLYLAARGYRERGLPLNLDATQPCLSIAPAQQTRRRL
jgi:hypothetical protein